MVVELLNKLKLRKQQLQKLVNYNQRNEDENKTFEISLSKENNFFKMEISDYISIVDYDKRMKQIDNFGLEFLISNAVLWNSSKQKVNKGLYYVLSINNRLYNILIEENHIKIDERIKTNDTTEEKIISLNIKNNDYHYTVHRHDNTGNTFYTRYFNKSKFSFEKLYLTEEEFFESISSLIHNLEDIDSIRNIVDIELLKEYILDDLKKIFCKKSCENI